MKKLAIYIPSIEAGGVEKNLFYISAYLLKKNIDLTIVTANRNKKSTANLSDSNSRKIAGEKPQDNVPRSCSCRQRRLCASLLQHVGNDRESGRTGCSRNRSGDQRTSFSSSNKVCHTTHKRSSATAATRSDDTTFVPSMYQRNCCVRRRCECSSTDWIEKDG